MVYEVELCNLRRIISALLKPAEPISFPVHWVNTVTARSAMLLILSYLQKTGVIEDKNSLFLVPQWLCISMLQMMRKHCSPTLDPGCRTIRAVLVYHQYGFPQNMDEVLDYCDRKGIVVIENCANLFKGFYRGKRLGTFGLAAIFSLSKVFPSIWGGGMATGNEELYHHALEEQRSTHSSWISLFLHLAKYCADRDRENADSRWNIPIQMAYAVAEYAQKMSFVSNRIISTQLKERALERRAENYRLLRHLCRNTAYFDHLELDGVSPYVLPLYAPEDTLHEIVERLRGKGYFSGVYHFDMNRNIFAPNFQRCAWIPVHQGVSTSQMEEICELILSC
ncbi:MAG: DegT/DnrJ/EryC1/StrS family aminotransferase [Chloroflexi bacterium]|nr:DegT/DnrJ/EryC1/StrS family aminotransferase [Chloroflexota bacterium]